MRLNREKTEQFLNSRGWSEVMFARKLDLDYSYVYRVMRGERGVGKKFLAGLIKLCEKEGLNFREFIFLD
ncbi:MAG: helix-turn-helix domain-containing protein [Halanaerobiales bacterium]|nr:helix-turn-helix domain-containing protein [Halanaerobiales bacterium]